MKIKLFHLGIVAIFSLALGLFLGSQIGISIADTFSQFIKIEAEITAYSPSPNQTWGDNPFEMASGKIAKPQDLEQIKYVALSRDFLKKYNIQYNDKIWISFNVQDKMGPKAKKNVDIFFRSIDLAKKFGRQNRTIIIERR